MIRNQRVYRRGMTAYRPTPPASPAAFGVGPCLTRTGEAIHAATGDGRTRCGEVAARLIGASIGATVTCERCGA